MKVTVKHDEAAGMSPAEVRARQMRDAQFRECYAALLKPGASEVVRVASGFTGLNLGQMVEKARVTR